MKCQNCRDKDAELLTVWERIRNWLFLRFNHIFFPQDFDDLKSEKYTQGYSDGTTQGFERGIKTLKPQDYPTPDKLFPQVEYHGKD